MIEEQIQKARLCRIEIAGGIACAVADLDGARIVRVNRLPNEMDRIARLQLVCDGFPRQSARHGQAHGPDERDRTSRD